jgi:hypothetical protein
MPEPTEPKRREPLYDPCQLCSRRESLGGGLCESCERHVATNEDGARDWNAMNGRHPSGRSRYRRRRW